MKQDVIVISERHRAKIIAKDEIKIYNNQEFTLDISVLGV